MITDKLYKVKVGFKNYIDLVVEANQAQAAQEAFGKFGNVTLSSRRDGTFNLRLEYEYFTSLVDIQPVVKQFQKK